MFRKLFSCFGTEDEPQRARVVQTIPVRVQSTRVDEINLVSTSTSSCQAISRRNRTDIKDMKEIVLENCEAYGKLYWIVDGDTFKYIIPILDSDLIRYYNVDGFIKFKNVNLETDTYSWVKVNIRLAGYGKAGGADAYEKETLLGQICHVYSYGALGFKGWTRIVFKGPNSTNSDLKSTKEPHGRSLGIIYMEDGRQWDKVILEVCDYALIEKTNNRLKTLIGYSLPFILPAKGKVLGVPYNGVGDKAAVVKSMRERKLAYNNVKRELNNYIKSSL